MAMKPYTVTFVADHFTMNVLAELDLSEPDINGTGDDELEQVAADFARNMLMYHYGIDIAKLCDITEVREG
jgi:hypothetical protein